MEGRMTDPIIAAARFLQAHLDWLRHRSATEIQECFADIAAAARVVAGIARGPSEQKYLGPCGAVQGRCEGLEPDDWPEADCGDHTPHPAHYDAPCDGDVYGRAGAEKGACRTCETEHDQEKRRKWLDEQAGRSDLVWTAVNIADALTINVKTLRAWATERRAPNGVVLRQAKLATYWRNSDGQLVPWVEPREGEDVKARGDRLHYVADVVDLAREAADRREAERARKDTPQPELTTSP